MTPENDKERLLVASIDAKGEAILGTGTPWAEGILLFAIDPEPTERQETLIAKRLRYWEDRIVGANGRSAPSTHK
jgi:hypothetical protein